MNISLNENIKYKSLKKGEVLFRESDASDKTFIVSKGELCSFLVEESRAVPLYVYKENEFVGEASNFNDKFYSQNCTALVDSDLIVIENKDIELFLAESSPWISSILGEISDKLKSTQSTIKNHKIINSSLFKGDFNNELESFLLESL